ncbi:hypothetical protein D3C72_832430 [compost metagenome]
MHVGVADQGVEHQPPDELAHPGFAGFQPEDLRQIAIGPLVVLLARIDAEDLCEVLDMDAAAILPAIETTDGERLLLDLADPLGQPLDLIERHQLHVGDVHAHGAGQPHHRELVGCYAAKPDGWQLDDPVSAPTARRDRQTALGLLDR